jgi:hypothetical protein
MRIVYLRLGKFLLLAQGAADDADTFLTHYVATVASVMHYYLGAFHAESGSGGGGGGGGGGGLDTGLGGREAAQACLDIVAAAVDPAAAGNGGSGGGGGDGAALLAHVMDGVRFVFVAQAALMQVDRLLADMEDSDVVVGSALLLGESVLHSR